MAYRLEKNGDDTDLVISGWEKGIAQNPYEGPQDMRGVNIGTVPGEVSVGFGLTASATSGATLDVPISSAVEYSSGSAISYAMLDTVGNIFTTTSISGTWASVGATTTSAQNTDGIAIWHGYIFHFRNSSIDYATISGGTVGTWHNAWKSITGTTQHASLVGQDDVLYFCNGAAVGSIIQVAGKTFDPTDATTYTFNTSALALPSTDIAQSLAQLGINLLVGGSQNAIYPWNRTATSFSYPIFCADTFIRKMVTANNKVFIFPGNVTGRGRIFVTNGSGVDVFAKFPDSISGYQEPYYRFYDAIYHRNALIFGVAVTQNGTGAVITSPSASIWMIDLAQNALRGISDTIGGSGSARVLIADTSNNSHPGMAFMVGYSDGSINGIAYSGTAAGTGSAVIKTEQIPVGTFLRPKTYTQMEFKLGQPLASGESILVQGIPDFTSTSFTTFNTVGTFSGVVPVNFQANQWLQLEIELNGASPTSGCRLREIRLR